MTTALGWPGMMVVLGELSFEQFYNFLLNLSCSNELKFWMACNAACNFRCVEASPLYTLYCDFLSDAAAYKVETKGKTRSSLAKLLFLSLSAPETMRIKELLGLAQFEMSKNVTGGSVGDLPFIYDLTVNNCCLLSKTGEGELSVPQLTLRQKAGREGIFLYSLPLKIYCIRSKKLSVT